MGPSLVLSIPGSNEGVLLCGLEGTGRKPIIYYLTSVISSGNENRTSFLHQALLTDFYTIARAYHPCPLAPRFARKLMKGCFTFNNLRT